MPPERLRLADDEDRFRVAVGAVVHRHRKATRMTQEVLAEAAEMHVRYLRDVEAGRSNPSMLKLRALAESVGTTFGVLCVEIEAEARAQPASG